MKEAFRTTDYFEKFHLNTFNINVSDSDTELGTCELLDETKDSLSTSRNSDFLYDEDIDLNSNYSVNSGQEIDSAENSCDDGELSGEIQNYPIIVKMSDISNSDLLSIDSDTSEIESLEESEES